MQLPEKTYQPLASEDVDDTAALFRDAYPPQSDQLPPSVATSDAAQQGTATAVPVSPAVNEEKGSTAGFTASSVNLLKTIVGAGILLQPCAFSRVGIIPGIVLVFMAAAMAYYGLVLLARIGEACGRPADLGSAARLAGFPAATPLLDAVLVLKCFWCSTLYLGILGDLLRDIYNSEGSAADAAANAVLEGGQLWKLAVLLCIAPLAVARQLAFLRYTSLLGLLGLLYLLGVCVWSFGVRLAAGTLPSALGDLLFPQPGSTGSADFARGLAGAFSTLALSFTCHHNLLPIQNEHGTRNSARAMRPVIIFGIAAATAAYTLFAALSYATYGGKVLTNEDYDGNILRVYKAVHGNGARPFILARVFYLVLLFGSVPLQVLPCRASLLKIARYFLAKHGGVPGGAAGGSDAHKDGETASTQQPPAPSSLAAAVEAASEGRGLLFYGLTGVILGGMWCMAMMPSKTIAKLIGATTSPLICFVFPAVLAWRIDRSVLGPAASFGPLILGVLGLAIIPPLLLAIF